jgi:regulator of protease activity HflC (stomatin/prohibitin superfamily)
MRDPVVPIIFASIVGVALVATTLNAAYIVDEGRVGVRTYMGKAVSQEGPSGLRFKTPFLAGIKEFDVRERALTVELNAATSNQLPTTMTVSVNWTPDPDQILQIFKRYGSPAEFATNTIRPRLKQSLKSTIGRFSGSQLTRERQAVAAQMLETAKTVLSAYPALINSVQIENFSLPERYMEAVLQKEEQRENTEKQQLLLEQQDIKAKEDVQTANAKRDATKAEADGRAYATKTNAVADAEAIKLLAQAEADGITAVAKAMGTNALIVELERVKKWSGVLPVTVMGDQPELLMQMPN